MKTFPWALTGSGVTGSPLPRMSRLPYLATLQTRLGKEKAHQRALAKAAEIGSETHGYIEWTLRRERERGSRPRAPDLG
jgi:hypothetical protein